MLSVTLTHEESWSEGVCSLRLSSPEEGTFDIRLDISTLAAVNSDGTLTLVLPSSFSSHSHPWATLPLALILTLCSLDFTFHV